MSLAGLASERLVEYPPGLTTDGSLDLKNLEINHYLPAQIIAGHVDAERNSGLSAINTQPVRLRLRLLGHNALTLKSYRKFTIAFAQIEQRRLSSGWLPRVARSKKLVSITWLISIPATDQLLVIAVLCRTAPWVVRSLFRPRAPFFYHGRTKVRVTTDDVIVHTSDPRRLIVIITTAVCRFAVASLHAPDQSHDECLTWWRDTTALFSHDLKHIAKIVFIDSNITLPSVWDLREPNHVDKKSMPSNVLNAGIFDELIHSAGRWVPAALPSSWREQVSKATFIARGYSTFNDYVLLSNEIACTPGSYDLEESYVTANKADDHLMVSVEGVLMPNFSKSFKRRRTVTYDRKGYRNPEKAAYFSTLVSKCPPVPFHVDPSSHCFFLEEWIRAAAEAAFPKPRFVKMSEILADDTFDFILARGRLRKRFRSAGRDISKMLNKTIAHWVFRAWASAVSLVPQPLIEFSYDFRNRCFDRCMSSLAIDAWTERIRISFDRDLEVYIDEKNQKLDAAASKVDTRELYSILKPIYKTTQNGAAVVLDKSGCMTSSLRVTKAAISDHFASLLCGQRTSMSRLIQKDREENCATASDLIIDRVDWNLIPSVSKVAQTFAHLSHLLDFQKTGTDLKSLKQRPWHVQKLFIRSSLNRHWLSNRLFSGREGTSSKSTKGKAPHAI